MKIHKENVKLYFKDKNTIIALSLLFVFLCAFFYTLFPSSTAIKGIAELFSTSKIEQIYSNNYSTIYAVDENNKLYYSFDKRVPGHLNNFEGITSLDNEYGDATSHFYNFIVFLYIIHQAAPAYSQANFLPAYLTIPKKSLPFYKIFLHKKAGIQFFQINF